MEICFKAMYIKDINASTNLRSLFLADENVVTILNIGGGHDFLVLHMHIRNCRQCFRKKQTSFSCPVKNRPLCSACCSSLPFAGCMHGGIVRLLSPQGTSLNSFSVNFHPLPNSDKPFLPPTPQ